MKISELNAMDRIDALLDAHAILLHEERGHYPVVCGKRTYEFFGEPAKISNANVYDVPANAEVTMEGAFGGVQQTEFTDVSWSFGRYFSIRVRDNCENELAVAREFLGVTVDLSMRMAALRKQYIEETGEDARSQIEAELIGMSHGVEDHSELLGDDWDMPCACKACLLYGDRVD